MSWYQSPIQPFDPVVVSQQPKPPFRYMRDNFAGTGQNSYVQPPAQDQAQWQALTNIQPITQGILNQRWGYNQFISLDPGNPNRLYNFQSDATGVRYLLAAGASDVQIFSEQGQNLLGSLFTPSTPSVIRSITSRNYQYFCNGSNTINSSTHRSGNSLKWSGSLNPTGDPQCLTNIGISTVDVTANTSSGGTTGNTVGPNFGTTASDVASGFPGATTWSNPTGMFTSGFSTPATTTLSVTYVGGSQTAISLDTDYLQGLGFFNSASGTGVAGIQLTVQYEATSFGISTGLYSLNAQLVKNGVATGTIEGGSITNDGAAHSFTLGGPTDLWGTSWALADLVATNFGVQMYALAGTGSAPNGTYTSTLKVSTVKLEVFFTGSTGTSSTSGAGVGILNAVGGGSVDLTLGRTYYLVGNNSVTGHFSDLSVASSSTGAATNSEFSLLLATYNDPQVDTKYVLATADGGDPSILYEVQALVPGFTITSWSINGSNVVTFVGTWTGSQYAVGTTFVVGGLSHGSYMNGQTLTTTGTSGTGLSANFTHTTDSATESGIAGNLSFAIPNGVTMVVDNTPDPMLVLAQPLVYTDQFGSEFGVTQNDPPKAIKLFIKHQGRLWGAGIPGSTHSVYFTKSVTELTLPDGFIAGKYEEAWPADNYFDVSDGAESVSGLLSDGTTLYIGTQNHIRRFVGSDPTTFQEPQIVHPEVGLINQEVWQIVFMQGSPSGCCWMTPDFRVIQSDFNTYADIGTPVQNILNNLQSTAPSLAHAAFVADGEFELYILAVPYLQSTYCDTHLVFDLRNRVWFVWQPASGSSSILYNVTQAALPQWLFLDANGSNVFQYSSTATTDNGTTIPVTATTTWMHLGEPTRRKVLNEIQVYGNTGMTVSVFGANNLGDFASPVTIASGLSLIQNPFLVWVAYLIDSVCKHRYYQFSFTASNGQVPLLGSYSISTLPLDDV